MGFPEWTLWGMGISGLGALLMIGLALLAQSPTTLARMRLLSARLDVRARTFTGYGFALLLLAFGFFFAGVPIGTVETADAITPDSQAPSLTSLAATNDVTDVLTDTLTADNTTPRPTISSASSGSFGAPPSDTTEEETVPTAEAATPEPNATIAPTTAPTNTPPATSTPTGTPSHTPTSTATSTPTNTPTPTVTPTPIEGETAVITTQGNPISVRRAPGSQQILAQLQNGTVIVMQNGRASQGGLLWREIRTVEGVLGWVPEEFLSFDEP